MVWFKYLKSSETINSSTPSFNYSYPYAKKVLQKFIPKDDLTLGTWVSIPLGESKPSSYLDSNLVESMDQSSYLVVYEYDEGLEVGLPTRCFIDDNNILFFETKQSHAAYQEIDGDYSLYYHTPNLRYVKPITESAVEDGDDFDGPLIYQVTDSFDAANYFLATQDDIDDLTFEVTLDSITYYNFSFLNADTNWTQGATEYPGSRLYISFPGPEIRIFGSKGPDYGKFKITITALDSGDGRPAEAVEKESIVDCYSSTQQNDVLLFSRTSNELEFRDYVIDITVLNEKNILSTGNKFKVNSYKFNYNIYSSFGAEQLSDKISLVSTGMFRGA